MASHVQVLLRRSLEHVGRVGEVVRVRPGYARNFLLPQGLAVLPTKENLRLVEKDKASEAVAEAERARLRTELVARLGAAQVRLEVKSNPEGHLFGSVTAAQVAAALTAMGLAVEERQLRMEPVKELGEYEIPVHLAADAEAKVKLWVLDEVTKRSSKADPVAERAEAKAEPTGKPGRAKRPAK